MELTEDDEETTTVEIVHTKEDNSTRSQHLALVILKNKVSLLYTTGKQRTPTCSSCSSVFCQCVRAWKTKLTTATTQFNIQENNRNNSLNDDSLENVNNDIDDCPKEDEAHYNQKDTRYGYNETEITFPLYSCPYQKSLIERKQKGSFNLPEALIPKFDPKKTL